MLESQNLTKEYKRHVKILDDLSYEFQEGIYGLLGPNGAGKTTWMKILTGADFPNSGRVLFEGKSILSKESDYSANLGYMPQENAMYPNFKAHDYLRYMAALKGMEKAEAEKQILELAEVCGLSDELEKRCRQYSGGMKRRLCLMQAMLNHPKVLILDEPSAGLDPAERLNVRNILAGLAKSTLLIISTHIVSDIDRLATHVLFMKKGQIVHEGEPRQLCETLGDRVAEIVTEDAFDLQLLEPFAQKLSMRQDPQGQVFRVLMNPDCEPEALLKLSGVEKVSSSPACLEDIYMEIIGKSWEKGAASESAGLGH